MENEGINVLSLFDGMSCGQIALNKIGMKINNYYASEIDKYAQIVSKANYPNTIYIGDVRKINIDNLLPIDLLIGGSPCQSFSFAGKRAGMTTKTNIEILQLEHYLELKEQNFEFEGQSYLFWEYIKALTEIRKYSPNVKFLLENVIMGAKWQKVITQAIGINPICINSSLLSAQNRERLYWTNINSSPSGFFDDFTCKIEQPKDKKILLKDILEKEVSKKYFLSEKFDNWLQKHSEKRGNEYKKTTGDRKAACLSVSALKSVNLSADFIVNERKIIDEGNLYGQNTRWGIYGKDGISPAITASSGMGGGHVPMIEVEKNEIIKYDCIETVLVRKNDVDIINLQKCLKEHKILKSKEIAKLLNVSETKVEHWFRTDTFFAIPDREYWLQLKSILNIKTTDFDKSIMEFEEKEGVYDKNNRIYDENGIAPTLTSASKNEKILTRKVHQLSNDNKSNGVTQPYQQDRIYDENGISPALSSGKSDLMIKKNCESKTAKITSEVRRLTPIECERLQTVPDNYTNHVSDSQRYKMIGNGWTVDVVAYILNYYKKEFYGE